MAVADYAENHGSLPKILRLALDCEYFNARPRDGGILDQPAGLLMKIRVAMNVYRAYTAYGRDGKKAGEMAKWKMENADLWEIVSDVERLRNG